MKLTKKLVYLVAGGLAILAFLMAFLSPIKNGSLSYKFNNVYFTVGMSKGATIVFIGLVVALLCGAYLIASNFIKIPKDNVIKYVVIGLLVLVAVLCFLTKVIWCNANGANPANFPTMKLNIGAIFAGIFALLSAIATAYAVFFVKE